MVRAAAAAVVLLLILGITLVANSEAAQDKLREWFSLVPGLGIKVTDDQTRVLASPLAIESAGESGLISAAAAGPERTEIRMRITGLPHPFGMATFDGSWNSISPYLQPDFPAELVLPDGGRMAPYTIKYRFDRGNLSATFLFGALPVGVNSVRLEVPHYRGIDLGVTANLALTNAHAVQYAEAIPTPVASAELHGVKVESLHYALEGDLIRFSMGVAPVTPAVRMGHGIRGEFDWVRLTDDNGQVYPLLVEESDRLNGLSQQFNVAFTGPLKKDAGALTLTVPHLYLFEEGTSAFELDVSDMTVGTYKTLNQSLQVGEWPVVIKGVTRKKVDQFSFTIDLGKPVGDRELSHLHARVGSNLRANGTSQNGQQTAMVDIQPTDGLIRFQWTRPSVAVTGPWVVTVPLQ